MIMPCKTEIGICVVPVANPCCCPSAIRIESLAGLNGSYCIGQFANAAKVVAGVIEAEIAGRANNLHSNRIISLGHDVVSIALLGDFGADP